MSDIKNLHQAVAYLALISFNNGVDHLLQDWGVPGFEGSSCQHFTDMQPTNRRPNTRSKHQIPNIKDQTPKVNTCCRIPTFFSPTRWPHSSHLWTRHTAEEGTEFQLNIWCPTNGNKHSNIWTFEVLPTASRLEQCEALRRNRSLLGRGRQSCSCGCWGQSWDAFQSRTLELPDIWITIHVWKHGTITV